MSKSDGYFTQEIVFSIRTEFESYVRAMAAAAAAAAVVEQITCEREDQPEHNQSRAGAERRRTKDEKIEANMCVDSVRLCAL